jgi:hypothetical protein
MVSAFQLLTSQQLKLIHTDSDVDLFESTGNTGIAKTMLGEITDKTNQARAFSLFGLTWSIGGIRKSVVIFLFVSNNQK